eukprot:1598-Heterococcus_DN1.PRE.1
MLTFVKSSCQIDSYKSDVSYLNVIIETAGLVLPAVQQPKCITVTKVFKLVLSHKSCRCTHSVKNTSVHSRCTQSVERTCNAVMVIADAMRVRIANAPAQSFTLSLSAFHSYN